MMITKSLSRFSATAAVRARSTNLRTKQSPRHLTVGESVIVDAPLRTVNNDVTTTKELFSGKKAVLVSIPGCFTPVCTAKHIPGYIEKIKEFAAKDTSVYCVSVNDPFVMKAFGEHLGDSSVTMLADFDAKFTTAINENIDLSEAGLGVRGHRFAAILENGVVKSHLKEENPGQLEVSTASNVLKHL